jgi:hypothetical protein
MPTPKKQADTKTSSGVEEHDPVLQYLKRNNIPVTRENYLSIAGVDHENGEIDAEREADLPPSLQNKE